MSLPTPDARRALAEERLRARLAASSGQGQIPCNPVEGLAPLSSAQERLWIQQQFDPVNASANRPMALRLIGPLQRDALRGSINEIVRRHAVLRTVYHQRSDGLVQQVLPPGEVPFQVVDFCEATDDEVARRVAVEARRAFDLEAGPMTRCVLLQRAAEDHVLLLLFHHIAFDGWSEQICRGELAVLYEAFSQGMPSPLAEPSIQYSDFARWQRAQVREGALNGQRAYWRQHLADLPALELSTDFHRPNAPLVEGARHAVVLSKPLLERAKRLARAEQATLFMVLLAAFETLLHRHSGQGDFGVGVPVAGRSHPDTEPLIGCFINLLVERADLSGDPSFRELLGRVRHTALSAHTHQDVPFAEVVEALHPERRVNRAPLAQVFFQLRNMPKQPVTPAAGLRIEPAMLDVGIIGGQDLSLELEETPDGLSGSFSYSTDLFEPATIACLACHFQNLLDAALADPDVPVSHLSMISEAERRRLLEEWNDTAVAFPDELCLHQLFEAQADRTPHAVAFVNEREELTYGALERRANQLAQALSKQGVGPGVLVGLCMERSFEMVAALLAILKAGGAFVPLEPTLPPARLRFMVEDAAPALILTQRHLAECFPVSATPLFFVEGTSGDEYSSERVVSGVQPEDLVYVLYTSGSTGHPKGVMIEHRAVCNHMYWMSTAWPMEADTIGLMHTPLIYDVSVCELFAPMMAGARLIVARSGSEGDPAYLARLIAKHHVTYLHAVPSLLRSLVAEPAFQDARSLQCIITGGEVLPVDLAERLLEQTHADLHNGYGPTENAIDSTTWQCRLGDRHRTVSIGRPLANVQVYVLDEQCQLVPQGIAGELYIGGTQLARGYLNRPDLTAERFMPDPFSSMPGARLYRSGDFVRWRSDGTLEFIGRRDHQVKLRGMRVELGEIEAVLLAHESVHACVVTVRDMGPGDQRLVAYVAGEDAVSGSVLQAHLAQQLPKHMVPAQFVWLDALPQLPSGKIDRHALPVPPVSSLREGEYEPPNTPLERTLAEIWAKVLQVEKVGRKDNFFSLGGHSLLVTQAIWLIRKQLGVEVPLASFFEASNLARLAETLAQGRYGGVLDTVESYAQAASDHEGESIIAPVSFSQRRLWFLEQLEPGTSRYNMTTVLRLVGPLNVAALEHGLHTVIQRHGTLRTTFVVRNGELMQVIAPDTLFRLHIENLEHLGAAERTAELRRRLDEEARLPFELESGPLLRARVWRLGQDEHVLALTMHHIVSDGWSLSVLWDELAALSQMATLPALPIQYAEYAVWQRESMASARWQGQLAYWKAKLVDVAVTELPLDRARPVSPTHRAGRLTELLPEALSEALRALGRRERTTLFVVLLAAFDVLVHRYTQQEDLAVGTPVAGRSHVHCEPLIGCFINTLVLRMDLSGDPTFQALMKRVRQVTLEAQANQEVPFEMIVGALNPTRDLHRPPLFQILFNMDTLPAPNFTLRGLRVELLDPPEPEAKYDLTLYVRTQQADLRFELVYDKDLFDEATMHHFLAQYKGLLKQVASRPDQPISTYTLLTGQDRALLPNPQEVLDAPRYATVTTQVHVQARRIPNARAIEWGATVMTYGVLAARMDRLARVLRAVGIEQGTVIALAGPRSPGLVVGMLATWACGGIALPLDPHLPERRRQQMMDEAGATFLMRVTSSPIDAEAAIPAIDVYAETGLPVRPLHDHKANALPEVSPDAPAYVFFTSGSTGIPKAILGDHNGVAHFLTWQRTHFGVGLGDRCAGLTSLSFDVMLRDLFLPLTSGATLCLPPSELDPAITTAWLAEEAITIAHLVPSLVQSWLADALPVNLPTLRLSFFSGEPLTSELVYRWRATLSAEARVINLYGPTETTMAKSFYEVPPKAPEGLLPVGHPLPHTQILVMNPAHRLCGISEMGEIVLRTPYRTRGYLNQPEEQAERFVPNPFRLDPADLLYRSGDLGRYRADGTLTVLGRSDHQVKIRGVRIEPDEVAAVLAQHPSVAACAVGVREEIGGAMSLVAYVVATSPTAEADALRAFLAERLPPAMIPATFARVNRLPLTVNGKVDHRALAQVKVKESSPLKAFEAPRTPIEAQIAAVWEKMLQVDRAGIHDSFFDLGGHSLLAIRLLSQLGSLFGITVPLYTFFQAPTVAALANVVQQRRGAGSPTGDFTMLLDELEILSDEEVRRLLSESS